MGYKAKISNMKERIALYVMSQNQQPEPQELHQDSTQPVKKQLAEVQVDPRPMDMSTHMLGMIVMNETGESHLILNKNIESQEVLHPHRGMSERD